MTDMLTTKVLISLLIVSLLSQGAKAQAPGGIEGPLVWEKEWRGPTLEKGSLSKFNYNDYQMFSSDLGHKEYDLRNSNRISLFAVYSTENSKHIGILKADDKEVIWSKDSIVASKKVLLKSYNVPQILTFINSFDASKNHVLNLLIGSDSEKGEFNGGVAELIVYDRILGVQAKNRIESYLSIKYGLSLPLISDYYNSKGQIIREASDFYTFNHRVTMIGRDNGSNLYHKQSHNLHDSLELTIGLGALAPSNVDNDSQLEDQSFIMWADNDEKIQFGVGNEERYLDRKWQIQWIGEDARQMKFAIRIDAAQFKNFDASKSLFLLLSETSSFGSSQTTDWIRLKHDGGGLYSTTFDMAAMREGGAYFSFAQSPLNDGTDISSEHIRPNPVARGDWFSIYADNIKDQWIEVQVLDAIGRVVKSREMIVDEAVRFEERLFAPGQYFIHLKGESTDLSFKVVVQ